MVLMLFSLSLSAGSHSKQMVDSIHFLIPGGAGGGWDGTARGTGEALTKSGLLGKQPLRTCPAAAAEKRSAI